MQTLIKKIKEDYEVIIIDSPPIGIVSDALELSKYADINMIIIRQGSTKKSSVDVINTMYQESKIKNSATVLNDVDFSRTIYGHKYGYGNKYGYGYGYGYAYGYGYYDDVLAISPLHVTPFLFHPWSSSFPRKL